MKPLKWKLEAVRYEKGRWAWWLDCFVRGRASGSLDQTGTCRTKQDASRAGRRFAKTHGLLLEKTP